MQAHLVILQSRYLSAVLSRQKTIESRLTRSAVAPFGQVRQGDILFFKASGGPVCGIGRAGKVLKYDNLEPGRIGRLFETHNDGILADESYWQSRLDCRYCTLVWLEDVKTIEPVRISKKDWRAWVVLRPGSDYGLLGLLKNRNKGGTGNRKIASGTVRLRFGTAVKAVLACLSLLLFLGCNAPREQLNTFNCYYQQGDFAQAGCFCAKKIKDKGSQPGGNDLLWTLQLAAVERAQKRYRSSSELFDQAEDMLKHFDQSVKGLDTVGTTLVNENVVPYKGKVYEGVMVNTYKALNFMSLGQDELARVEFNRAIERQRRAKEYFSREIQKQKAEVEKAQSQQTVDYNRSIESSQVKDQLGQKYPNLYAFEAYPDFVNPFSTYIAGVFFAIIGEPDKAVDLLKESYGMAPQNQYIAADFADVEKWLDTGKAPEPMVWILFENGVGPIKEEFRIDLPLFLFTDKIYYAGIALPKLQERYGACPYLTVQSAAGAFRTETLAVMDRVIQTEFSKEYPQILTRAILSAGAKIAAQYVLTKQDNNASQAAAIAAALYQWATTAADVRIWSALPKEFQCARLPMPADNKLTIRTPQGTDFTISLRPCRYAIVYIKMVSAMNEPVFQVIEY